MSKVVLITGTSSGLGLALSIQMAEAGYKVFASMRDLNKSDELKKQISAKKLPIELRELDVQSQPSVQACVDAVIEQEGKIDILINNAGAGFVKTTENATEEEINWVTDVNYIGVVRCTKAVLPYMREARAGHIINITSVGGLVGQPFNEFYCAAKFAVEGYTEALASYVQPTFNIKFSLVEPGGIQSEFANSVLKQLEDTGGTQDDEYLPVLQQYISNAQKRSGTGVYQTADEVAQVVMSVANNETPPIRVRTSAWSEEFSRLKTLSDPDGLLLQKEVSQSLL